MMMLATQIRQAAAALLEFTIRMAPPDSRAWGQAMRSELNHVEGHWAAMRWSLGGAKVLAQSALAALFMPGRRGRGVPPDDELFGKSVPVRQVALFISGACVLAALVFFAAPPFRQALRVGLSPWAFAFHIASGNSHPGLEALAKRAEARHDPEGLAFCAVRFQRPGQSARLAEEAVRLDPKFIWLYAVVAMHQPESDEIGAWAERLEHWDPKNGLVHLIRAESIEHAHFRLGEWKPPTQEQEQAWQGAMAAAFESPRFDDYADRLAAINYRVATRYAFYDPFEVQSLEQTYLPVSIFDNSEKFAKSLLRSGAELEAKGDRQGGRGQYWTVARFGQLVDSQARTAFEHWMGTALEGMAYQQLQSSSEKEGNHEEAALFGYFATKFDAVKGEHPGFLEQSAFGMDVSRRNAAVVEISGLMIVVFAGLIALSTLILMVRRRGRAGSPAARARPVATMVVLGSAVGLLFASVTLYFTYRPYWYLFQSAIQKGGLSQTRDLREFLMNIRFLPWLSPHGHMVVLDALLYSRSLSFLFYVWASLTLLGVTGLALILLRHFPDRGGNFRVSP